MAKTEYEQTLSSLDDQSLPDARTNHQVGSSTQQNRLLLVRNCDCVRWMAATTATLIAVRPSNLLAPLLATFAMAVPAQAQSMLDQIILQKCSAAMQADFSKAGQTPPAGLVQQTCSCVVQQMQATHNLDLAKTVCSQQAGASSS